jgi:peptidoglycan hydrolase-like protein with peptidoglycan-binding domain
VKGIFVLLWRRPRDTIAGAIALFAALAILVNALFMQKGMHPAPIFANRLAPIAAPVGSLPAQPRMASDVRGDAARPRSDVVAEIQRELTRHGFYDGPADGNYGPKTDASIRDFEQAAGLRPSAEPNDVLLAAIARSTVKPLVAPRDNDPIAALLAPSPRVLAVQRALTDFGYGPLTPTGQINAETRSAIERFEKARHRPSTGQVSDQLVRDLASLTGRPLE